MATEYYRVQHNEEQEPLTESDGIDKTPWKWESETQLQQIRNTTPRWIWITHAVLFSISLSIFALSFSQKLSTCPESLPFTYSPAQSAVEYEIRKFDLPAVPQGPFVGKGPEVDAMWDYITDSIGDTMVSRKEMTQMGLDPNGALEITDPATGKRGFRVAVEVFHQLHCLNLIRQNNYKSYYKPFGGDTADEEGDLHGHIDHCIDALRQFVMCQGDVNVFAFRFPFNDGDPWPDYSTPHVCRNYERIRQWAVDHTVLQGQDEPDH